MADPVLTSDMTYGEILKVFQDFSDYDLETSPTRAKVYIKAGRMLLAIALRRSGQSSRAEEIEVAPEIMQEQVKSAVVWLASYNAANAGPRQVIPDPDWRDS